MAVMVWIQLGFPLVVFMAGLQRIDPALYVAFEGEGPVMVARGIGLLELNLRSRRAKPSKPCVGIEVVATHSRPALMPNVEAEPNRHPAVVPLG